MPVAIRFRWIWVGREFVISSCGRFFPSQSAFAGYGLEESHNVNYCIRRGHVAIRFRWIWVGRGVDQRQSDIVAIRFRWIWVGRELNNSPRSNIAGLIAVAIRFRWIWVGRVLPLGSLTTEAPSRNPLSLDMGWKSEACKVDRWKRVKCRNPLSLDMGWKRNQDRCQSQSQKSQSAFAGYGLEEVESEHPGFHDCRRNPLSLDMGWKRQKTSFLLS